VRRSDVACIDAETICASDQTFVDYFKHYRRHHGLQPDKHSSACTLEQESRTRCAADANLAETTIVAGPAHIRLFRTLRVPDNGREYPLPPVRAMAVCYRRFSPHTTAGARHIPARACAGACGAATRRNYRPRWPSYGSVSPGAAVEDTQADAAQPMYQSEALWMSFVGSSACAIKVYAGGVNAITGRRADDEREDGGQDYVAVPQQPWLGEGLVADPEASC
jgi:hypothetical protein